MAEKSQVLWVGVAHIKNMGAGAKIGNIEGAQAYIVVRAESAEEFKHKAIAIFRQNRFQVFSIEQIENEFDIPKDEDDPIALEKIELFKRLAQNRSKFVWGSFHPYGEYFQP